MAPKKKGKKKLVLPTYVNRSDPMPTLVDHNSHVRSNTPLSALATERSKNLITSCEKTLSALDAHIKEENDRLVVCNNAISNLELAIPEMNEALNSHKEILSALKHVQLHLPKIEVAGSLALKYEPLSDSLYRQAVATATGPVNRLKQAIDPEADALEEEVRTLMDMVYEMEVELEGWKVSRQSSTQLLKNIDESKRLVTSNLKTEKEIFRPIWRMPPNAWAAVFKYIINDAISAYLTSNNNHGFRHPIHVVSQVCHRWRYIAQNEPDLWEFVYVAPSNNWTQQEHDRVVDSRMRSNRPVTVISNIYQYFAIGNASGQRYDRNGTPVSIIVPNERTIFEGKPFNLFIDMHDDNPSYLERMWYLPLRNPTTLTLSARYPISQGHLFNHLSNYSSVQSLAIQNDNPTWFHHDAIGSLFPWLTTLRITVKQFPTFQLSGFLPATLEEFYLRHNDDSPLPQLSQDVNLPKLHTLGTSLLGKYLLDRLTAHSLQTLILYGPTNATNLIISETPKATDSFRRVQHLCLQDWRQPSEDNSLTSGSNSSNRGVVVFPELASKMKKLRSVTFDHCWVNGQRLVSTVEGALNDTGEGPLKRLEEITLSHPAGITRDQCEALQRMVKKVNVYV